MPGFKRKRYTKRRKAYSVKRRKIAYKSKKTYKKRRFSNRNKNILPQVITKKLYYIQEITLDPVVNDRDYHTFVTNSLFDPDYSTGGHQPMGYDQLSALYKNWQVTKASIKVLPSPVAVADATPMYVGIVISDVAAPPTFSGNEHFLETARYQGWPVQTFGAFQQMFGLNYRTTNVKAGWNSRRAFGPGADPQDQWGTITASPTSKQYFHIIGYSIAGNNPGSITFTVKITYTAKFFNQNLLVQS